MFTKQIRYSHGVPSANLVNFTFLLVDFDKVMSSSANDLQQNSNPSSTEEYIHKYWLFCYRFIVFTFQLCSVLSFVICKQWLNNVTTPSSNQRLWLVSGQILRHQYGISVAESQTFLRAKRPQQRRARRNGCFRRLRWFLFKVMYLLWRRYSPRKVEHVSTLFFSGTFRFVNHFKVYSVFVLRSNIKLNNAIKRCIYYIRSTYYHWWKIFYRKRTKYCRMLFSRTVCFSTMPTNIDFLFPYNFYPWFSSLFKTILFLFPGWLLFATIVDHH